MRGDGRGISKDSRVQALCASLLIILVFVGTPLHAQVPRLDYAFEVRQSFYQNASAPYPAAGALLEREPGIFWGTAARGGAHDAGVIFATYCGKYGEAYHEFNGADGEVPGGGLTKARDGYLYGATGYGGAHDDHGTIFKVSPDNVFSSLHSFSGPDGHGPWGPLAQGPDGCLYGTTVVGGAYNSGTVFKCTTNGTLTTLHSFNRADGFAPGAGLVLAGDGCFYGTTEYGGTNATSSFTGGTVFRVHTNGNLEVLVHFDASDWAHPNAPLCLGEDGHMYGTTRGGGTNGIGTVFRLTTNGILDTLAEFTRESGYAPFSGVTQGRDGALYGVTAYREENGVSTNGTIYRVYTNGVLEALFRLGDDVVPHATGELTAGSDGNLYGTLYDIDSYPASDGSYGQIYRLLTLPTITSALRVVQPGPAGFVSLTWNSLPNAIYDIDVRDSLTGDDWRLYVIGISTIDFSETYDVGIYSDAERYYRVRMRPPFN